MTIERNELQQEAVEAAFTLRDYMGCASFLAPTEGGMLLAFGTRADILAMLKEEGWVKYEGVD